MRRYAGPNNLRPVGPEQPTHLERIEVMQFAVSDGPFESVNHDDGARIADPRQMTRAQLRRLGVPRLVYLRCGTVDGEEAFAVHAADGIAIAVVEDVEVALELAMENNLTFVAVH